MHHERLGQRRPYGCSTAGMPLRLRMFNSVKPQRSTGCGVTWVEACVRREMYMMAVVLDMVVQKVTENQAWN